MLTPWGPSLSTQSFGRGITFYTTTDHAAFHVSPAVNRRVPDLLRIEDGWYEQDTDWCRLALAFPDRFTEAQYNTVRALVRDRMPSLYEKHFGEIIPYGMSEAKDRCTFLSAHSNDWLAYAAVGDWRADVPKGMAKVWAKRKRKEMQFLVPEAEYKMRGKLPFVIDLDRHVSLGHVEAA